ncbi:conserved protein of unknown function [Candidatus Nitrosocosmicus franklandus]|uniref:DUF4443 domain-containing protein n=1 Tax=Candidatus Nitrosocosmicus franklandianus TaxID=1798806 RepID=A0A484IEJ6_9ARCH|nr:conserved protein of unknown function [Candidatus Nitrosocosmicus franklandus]
MLKCYIITTLRTSYHKSKQHNHCINLTKLKGGRDNVISKICDDIFVHIVINTLNSISSRYAPSRVLSFSPAHVFKTLQLINRERYVSRFLLVRELELGEGSIKTLIKHLKMEKMIITTNKGTTMSEKGAKIFEQLSKYIPSELEIPQSSISISKFNYAILLIYMSNAIRQGIEQRDAAIKMGAKGATTLIFENGKFSIPGSKYNVLRNEKSLELLLKDGLRPINNDVIIIGSDDSSLILAELAAKAAALYTLENHGDHKELKLIANENRVVYKNNG